jgi:lipocalin
LVGGWAKLTTLKVTNIVRLKNYYDSWYEIAGVKK